MNLDIFRPIIGRVVGALVGALASWATARFAIAIDDSTRGQISAGLEAIVLAVFGVVYTLVHKGISVKVNPSDAAKPVLAAQSAAEEKTIKNLSEALDDIVAQTTTDGDARQ